MSRSNFYLFIVTKVYKFSSERYHRNIILVSISFLILFLTKFNNFLLIQDHIYKFWIFKSISSPDNKVFKFRTLKNAALDNAWLSNYILIRNLFWHYLMFSYSSKFSFFSSKYYILVEANYLIVYTRDGLPDFCLKAKIEN